MKFVLHLLLGALVMLVGLELVLQALPVSTSTQTGYHIHPNILTNPPHHRWTMATGWDLRDVQHMRANNYGFAAEHDFRPGSDAIGLVGDSYVVASMLPKSERPAAQLERAIDWRRQVYAFGGPGSSLLDYAERIRWAHQTLKLRDFVVMLESPDASQVLCDSGNVHARCLEPGTLKPTTQRRPESGQLKDLLRSSALAQYLNSQLLLSSERLTRPDFWRSGIQVHASPATASIPVLPAAHEGLDSRKQAVIDAAVDTFLAEVQELPDLRLVFVVDMNRRNLEPGIRRPDEGYHVALRLQARGYAVIRAEPLFRAHLSHSAQRLDMGPHDGHLNKIGVGLLMGATARTLKHHGFIDTTDRGN